MLSESYPDGKSQIGRLSPAGRSLNLQFLPENEGLRKDGVQHPCQPNYRDSSPLTGRWLASFECSAGQCQVWEVLTPMGGSFEHVRATKAGVYETCKAHSVHVTGCCVSQSLLTSGAL